MLALLGVIVLGVAIFALVLATVVKVGVRTYFREKRAHLQELLNPDNQKD